MQRGLLSFVFATLGLGSTAFAGQALYLDAGDPFGVLPSPVYGAAAGQAGTWNALGNSGGTAPVTLDDPLDATTGLPTAGVSVSVDAYAGNFTFDNGGTSGDDAALMDELFDLGGLGGFTVLTITGLMDGDYEVYTYAWAPDNGTFRTSVTVQNSTDPTQLVGGDWPGGFAAGTTHATHTVTVSGGSSIQVSMATDTGFGSFNGVQVLPAGPTRIGTSYCGPAVPNSTGLPGVISAFGSNVVADQDVTLVAEQLPAGFFGYFLVSRTQGMSMPMGSAGIICLDADIGRFAAPSQIFQGPMGELEVDLNAIPTSTPGSQMVQPGETLNFQAWNRDMPLPGGSNLTDAVSIGFL